MFSTKISLGGILGSAGDIYGSVSKYVPINDLVNEVIRAYNIDIPLTYGSIYNKLTDTMIPFLLPEEVSRSHSANLTELTTETRSVTAPYYSGGSSPTVSFTVLLYEDLYSIMMTKGMLGGSPTQYLKKAVGAYKGSTINELISAFRALTYPEYINGLARAPECLIYLGESHKYLARCTSVSDSTKGVTGLNGQNLPTHREATVSLSFTIIKEIKGTRKVPSASEIQSGKSGLSLGGGFFSW